MNAAAKVMLLFETAKFFPCFFLRTLFSPFHAAEVCLPMVVQRTARTALAGIVGPLQGMIGAPDGINDGCQDNDEGGDELNHGKGGRNSCAGWGRGTAGQSLESLRSISLLMA